MSIHEGHRQRLKERFLEEGLDNFTEVQVLELLLFYCIPRRDTNPIAHALLDRFGSLSQVLEARVEDVCEDTLELTEDPGTLIRFASTAVCTAEAQGQKGAEILSLTVNGVPLPATFPLVETGVFTFRATDSRGFVTEKTVQLPLVPYIPPTVNGWCSRPDGDGNAVLTLRGSCYRGMLGDGENQAVIADRL